MIAAASPGASENDTSDSTASGPRGVGYSLLRCVTVSISRVPHLRPRQHRLVDVELQVGGARDAVVLAHAVEAAGPEGIALGPVAPELQEPVGQRLGIVGLHQQP